MAKKKKHMKESYIDKDIYDMLKFIIIKLGISENILSLAEKMDMDLPSMFYYKMVKTKGWDEERYNNEKKALENNILGILGNFFAGFYFQNKGYKVEYESLQHDPAGDYKVDLKIEKDELIKYIEVKTTSKIYHPNRDYYDTIEYKNENTPESKREYIKYKKIGKQLLKQVTRLKENGFDAGVVIYLDCEIDPLIINELKGLKVTLLDPIPIDVTNLEERIRKLVDEVEKYIRTKKTIIEEKIK